MTTLSREEIAQAAKAIFEVWEGRGAWDQQSAGEQVFLIAAVHDALEPALSRLQWAEDDTAKCVLEAARKFGDARDAYLVSREPWRNGPLARRIDEALMSLRAAASAYHASLPPPPASTGEG